MTRISFDVESPHAVGDFRYLTLISVSSTLHLVVIGCFVSTHFDCVMWMKQEMGLNFLQRDEEVEFSIPKLVALDR